MKSEKLFFMIGNISDEYILSAEPKNRRKSQTVFRSFAASITAAAVIALIVFGNLILSTQNSFSVTAYAMEKQEDGTAAFREVDFANSSDDWYGYSDGKDFYLNVGLKCGGENIKSVELSTDDNCFFAKRRVDADGRSIPIENAPMLYGGGKNYFALTYNEFEKIGGSITLDRDVLNDDFILFLGKENADLKNHPQKMTVYALVTFDNGKTQEETITLDLSGMNAFLDAAYNNWLKNETKPITEIEPTTETASPTDIDLPQDADMSAETSYTPALTVLPQKSNIVYINGKSVDLNIDESAWEKEIWHTPQFAHVSAQRYIYGADGFTIAYELPHWGGHIYNMIRICTIMPDGSERWDVPTFEEAYAALDYDTVPNEIKEVVLESRYKILADPAWLKSDETIINEPGGNILHVPKHKPDISKFDMEQINQFADKYQLPRL